MSVVDVEHSPEFEKDMGYNVSFTIHTWKRWQEMLAHACLCFTRFQRAIERLVLAIATELQEVGIAMQKEAGQWIWVSKK